MKTHHPSNAEIFRIRWIAIKLMQLFENKVAYGFYANLILE